MVALILLLAGIMLCITRHKGWGFLCLALAFLIAVF